MSIALGTLADIPVDYQKDMVRANLTPLWPMMRDVLPHGRPVPVSKPCLWPYTAVRPLLIKAGEITPIEKAERRVLVLTDPGRGNGSMQVTSSIYCGMQLLLPGESAPAHRHTPSAARIIVEGEGAYTVVNGERLPMAHGDVVLTPGGMWHDHGHDGRAPVIWLDVLDLPLFVYLEGSYAEEGDIQAIRNRPDASEVEYGQAGLVPTRRFGQSAGLYPLLRFPWERTETALRGLARQTPLGEAVELDYVNPETGESCLLTLGFTAMLLRLGDRVRPPLRSAGAVFHIIDGEGTSVVNGDRFQWKRGDTFSTPVFADTEHVAAGGEAFLVRVHETPLQKKLGFYQERPRA